MSSEPIPSQAGIEGNNHTEAFVGKDLDTGRRLKAVREAHGFSQRELAKRAGITNSNISMIEQGQVSPSVQSLTRILSAFPMTLAEFFAVNHNNQSSVFFSREDLAATQIKCAQGSWVQQLAQPLMQRQLDLKITQLPSQTGTELHFSPTSDICGLVTQGSPELTLGTQLIKLQSGDGFYIQRGQFYRFKNPADIPAQFFTCSVFNPAV
jgi:transcriptional regulator with XRE-family HTH domain